MNSKFKLKTVCRSGSAVVRFTAAIALFGVSTQAPAEPLSAESIVEKAHCAAYYQGDSGRARASVTITDDQGRTRSRQLTLLRQDGEASHDGAMHCGEQKYYAYFHRPADLRKTALLTWKQNSGNDDRWLYLPALDLVKRIAAGDKRTSFVGSHFFYEDITGRNPGLDHHQLIAAEQRHYVLKHTPKNTQGIDFSYYVSWIDKDTLIPMRIEYHDRLESVFRTYETLEVASVQGYPTIIKSRMSDRNIGGETTITFSKVDYDISLNGSLFSERYLRNPPRRYLR